MSERDPPSSEPSDSFDASFESGDADESAQWLAAGYGAVNLDHRFTRYDERMVGDSRLLLTTAHLLGAYGVDLAPDLVLIATASGESRWEQGGEHGSLDAEPALFQPGRPCSTSVSDTRVRAAGFQRQDLQRTARLLHGEDAFDVRFDGPRPESSAAGARWLAVLELAQESARSGMLQQPLVRAGIHRLLAVTALESFRLVGDRRSLRASAERRLRVYRTGTEFLHAHASLPITVEAAAAATTTAELAAPFRAHDPHPRAAASRWCCAAGRRARSSAPGARSRSTCASGSSAEAPRPRRPSCPSPRPDRRGARVLAAAPGPGGGASATPNRCPTRGGASDDGDRDGAVA